MQESAPITPEITPPQAVVAPVAGTLENNASQKFPDPLDAVQNAPTQPTVPDSKNKNFWQTLIIFLILLPVVSIGFVFAYRMYLNNRLSSEGGLTTQQQIDPSKVVTPEALPMANSAKLPEGWKRLEMTALGYALAYPGDWTVDESIQNEIKLLNSNPSSPSYTLTILPVEKSVVSISELQNYVVEQDSRSPLKLSVLLESIGKTSSGLSYVSREITLASEIVARSDGYVALDKTILHIQGTGQTVASSSAVFEQILKTVTAVIPEKTSQSDEWVEYQNTFGYSLKYPRTVSLRSNDKNNVDESDLTKSASILLFPTSEIQNSDGFANSLQLSLTDTEPPQTATLSATRDFGTSEFKTHAKKGSTNYVGQLSSGNWLEIALSYDSNLAHRELLTKIIDTIVVKENEQQP